MISYKQPDSRIVRIGEHIEGLAKVRKEFEQERRSVSNMESNTHEGDVRCSFCGKEKKDVFFFVRSTKSDDGPYICDECVMSALSLMLYRGRGEQ